MGGGSLLESRSLREGMQMAETWKGFELRQEPKASAGHSQKLL